MRLPAGWRVTALCLAVGLWSGSAMAAEVVGVELWDNGAEMEMAKDQFYRSPDLDRSQATMGIKLDSTSSRAGVVTFHVTNSSTDTVHEMIVLHLFDPLQPLPYLEEEARVDEERAGDKGSGMVSELVPGATGSLTVARPGKYLLICNLPGHYAAGMWTEFEITK